jgi:hypothetical protein
MIRRRVLLVHIKLAVDAAEILSGVLRRNDFRV